MAKFLKDSDFVQLDDPYYSTSKQFFWDYLGGPGRVDSDVQSHWMCGATVVGAELMKIRKRAVENNVGLTDPHQKL